jgi:hypothetical protein
VRNAAQVSGADMVNRYALPDSALIAPPSLIAAKEREGNHDDKTNSSASVKTHSLDYGP